MPTAEEITPGDVHKTIKSLINQLVNIKDETGKFLLELPDGRIIDTKGWNDWEWTHGVGLYGIWQYYILSGDASNLETIEAWFKARFDSGGTTKNINTMAAFLTLAYVYEETGNEIYLPWLNEWAEWAMNELPRTKYGGMQHITYNSINEGELWDDTLMMTVLPLAKIGQVLNRPHYIEEAKRQFLVHIRYLFDTKTGLFFHGWTFKGNHNFARAFWARGNSWLTIVIPEFLELLDFAPNDPIRLHLIDTLDAQCAALCPLQAPDGLWRTLLDHPESEGSYLESSATAGFAFGLLKGVRKGYIHGDAYQKVALRAIEGVMSNITPEGELLKVSFGTAMGHDLQHYKDIERTSMPYGQAMAMLALVEFLQGFK
jgi:unsaturated rhamnogalacturonyl hydrolase